MIMIIGGDGNTYGPVPVDQVHRWLAEGRATLDTKAKRVGDADWKRLGEFPEFTNMAPPPMNAPVITAPSLISPTQEQQATQVSGTVLAARSLRLVAALIDGFLSMVVAMPGIIMLVIAIVRQGLTVEDLQHFNIMEYGAAVTVLGLGIFFLFAIQMTLLTLRAQSIGKILMKIRIVHVTQETHPGFVRLVLLRTFVPSLIGSLPYIGFFFTLTDICFIFRQDRRCLHDLIADTKVVELPNK